MSLSFGSKKQKTSQQETAQKDPWDETVPYLKDLLSQLGTVSGQSQGITQNEGNAIGDLTNIAKGGNPYADQIGAAATDALGTDFSGQTGTANAGYADYVRRMNPVADGTNMNIADNPEIQRLLQVVGDDVTNRVNSSFAASGRSFSGANQGAVARGVTAAQAPILLDQYNREAARSDTAAGNLFQAGNTNATTTAGLEQAEQGLRAAGVPMADAAMAAKTWGPETILQVEAALKDLPFDQLQRIANILFPAAGLGQQAQSQGTRTGKSSGFNLSADLGKALGSLMGG